MSIAGGAAAQERARINIEPQPLASALNAFGAQTGSPVISTPELTRTKVSPGVREADDPGAALTQLLAGTGLSYRCSGDTYLIVPAPQTQPAPSQTRCVARAGAGGSDGDAADAGTVEALIVTAQKKDEDIQDVPIAISAFSQKSLDAQKIEGGFDLLKAVPNVTFSKTNFSGYNFSIRGIGTQAVSVTTDPGVAVAQNNTTLIVNRLFEQEYVDMERVEVLRGPQGTLYGRNATAGVINVITAKPVLGDFFGEAKLETGNFNAQRFRGHINVPLGENLAVRGAFALTKRDGYGVNEAAASNDTRAFGDKVREDVDGRDLWTGRLSIGWEPIEAIRVNAIWERFKEDDNRVRTSKQLCHHDEGPKIPTSITAPGFATEDGYLNSNNFNNSAISQGCKPGSLYDDEAFGTPNGAALPYVAGMFISTQLGSNSIVQASTQGYLNSFGIGGRPWAGLPIEQRPCPAADTQLLGWGGPSYSPVDVCNPDPYGGRMQSHNLRSIYSAIEPTYRADSDIFEVSADFDLGDATLTSQTVYSRDEYYASQDYNRFTSLPLWNDTSKACGVSFDIFGKYTADCSSNPDTGVGTFGPLTDADHDGIVDQTHIPLNGGDPFRQQSSEYSVDPNGYVRDQTGNRVGFYRDLAPGGVFCDPQLGCSDSLVAQDLSKATSRQFSQEFRLVTDYDGKFNFSLGANYMRFETKNDYYVFINALSYITNFFPFNFHDSPCAKVDLICRYVDPNSLESVAGDGHNYFRSQNPYKLTSTAIFGETYWNITDTLKLTTGMRFTWDEKTFTPVSSQLLLADYRDVARAAQLVSLNGISGLQYLPEGGGPDFCDVSNISFSPDVLHCPLTGTAAGGRGLVASPDIVQTWREPTGRVVIDWKPDLGFTNDTLLYASAARGYKGGGANPPSVAAPAKYSFDAASGGAYPDVFLPEYVKSFEVGTKNTLLDGMLVLNADAFYYDYTDYQVSKIADRRAVNENFDANIWGAEFEWVFSPTRNLRFNGAVGYLQTRIADGEQSIDLMDRTDGDHRCYNPKEHNPDSEWDQTFCEWMTLQPFVNAAALAVVPVNLIQANSNPDPERNLLNLLNYFTPNGGPVGGTAGRAGYYDEDGNLVPTGVSTRTWIATRDAPNGGAGFFKDLGGNELPSAPRWTFSFGAQYSFTLPAGWDATVRTDFYWQDDSWARVYNLEGYDKLKAWSNTNLSLWVENPDWGVKAEVYAKNVLDETPITGAFLNSEDSGLTTNVFTLDPRLVGVSVTKSF
jgi:outer membrane receptor protein involved in Fe transport